MIDERFAASVSAWLRRTDAPSPHAARNVSQAMAEIHRTGQRRHWLWFLPGPKPTAGADDHARQATPTMTDHRTGGTRSMFSATKLFAGAATVALLGVLVVSGPFAGEPRPETTSSIGADPGEISRYSGVLRLMKNHDPGTIEYTDWGSRMEGGRLSATHEMDDPRVSGISHCNYSQFTTDNGAGWLRANNCRLFNDEGSWHSMSRGYLAPGNGGVHYQHEMVGEGGYDGLFAVQRCDMPAQTATMECEGAVYQGGFPDTPAEAPDTPPGG